MKRAQELLKEYNEMEEKLFQGGKAYQEIPEHRWKDIEVALEALGFTLSSPAQGYSTIKYSCPYGAGGTSYLD